jgi:hypothetical protein
VLEKRRSIIDVITVEAPTSTKNGAKSRDRKCIGAGKGTNGISG